MVIKVATFFCLVAAASAVAIPAVSVAKLTYPEPAYPAQYAYSYSVQDQLSGDIKEQKEDRDGDVVHGFYSFVQPDGTQRIVEYTADKEHGFNAVVRYEGQPHGHAKAAPVTKVAVPHDIAYPAPFTKAAVPAPEHSVAYNAPVTKVTYSAPASKVSYAPPVVYATPAPVAYAAAPVAKVAYSNPAPVVYAYSAPVAYANQVPVSYANHQAPVAFTNYASPAHITYAHTPTAPYHTGLGHVTYSSPAFSYHH